MQRSQNPSITLDVKNHIESFALNYLGITNPLSLFQSIINLKENSGESTTQNIIFSLMSHTHHSIYEKTALLEKNIIEKKTIDIIKNALPRTMESSIPYCIGLMDERSFKLLLNGSTLKDILYQLKPSETPFYKNTLHPKGWFFGKPNKQVIETDISYNTLLVIDKVMKSNTLSLEIKNEFLQLIENRIEKYTHSTIALFKKEMSIFSKENNKIEFNEQSTLEE